jgi:hypothetical protein
MVTHKKEVRQRCDDFKRQQGENVGAGVTVSISTMSNDLSAKINYCTTDMKKLPNASQGMRQR